MPKSKREIEREKEEARLAAKRRRNKASSIRVLIAKGKDVTEEQRAYLAAYDAEPHGNFRGDEDPGPVDPLGATIDQAGATGPEASEPAASSGAPASADGAPPVAPPAPPAQAAPPPPPAPPPGPARAPAPPPPPPVTPGRSADGASDWRTKYGGGPGGDRELICKQGAGIWQRFTIVLADQIAESEGRPVIDARAPEWFNLLVLATDGVLPKDLSITPPMEAAGLTTALLVQRALRAKKLAEVRRRYSGASKYAPPVDHRPPPSQPAPPPSPVTVERASPDDRPTADPAPSNGASQHVAIRSETDPTTVTRGDSPFAGKPFS